MLFGCLPPGTFSPLSRPSSAPTYSRVLIALAQGPFAAETGDGTARREDVLRAIAEAILDGDLSDEAEEAQDAAARARYAYDVVLRAGWIEHVRDGWRTVVEMPPPIMRLAHLLGEDLPKEAEGGSVGAAMAAVDGLLGVAERAPERSAQALLEADRVAAGVVTTMRGALARARGFSRRIFREVSEEGLVSAFFDEFVRDLHLRDYAEMTDVATHPWRLRDGILERIDRLRHGSDISDRLCAALVANGSASSLGEARLAAERAMLRLQGALEASESLRERIEVVKLATERRFATSLRYRAHGGSGDLVRRVLALPFENGEWAGSLLTAEDIPIGPATLRLPGLKRRDVAPKPAEARSVDPAVVAWHAAVVAYQETLNPPVEMLAERAVDLLRRLGITQIDGKDIPCRALPDAIMVAALCDAARRQPTGEAQEVAPGVLLQPSPHPITNEWLRAPDGFVISLESGYA